MNFGKTETVKGTLRKEFGEVTLHADDGRVLKVRVKGEDSSYLGSLADGYVGITGLAPSGCGIIFVEKKSHIDPIMRTPSRSPQPPQS